MTFHIDPEAARQDSPGRVHAICMACGRKAEGHVIGWDLILPGERHETRALFHVDCALKMAGGMIADGWKHRHRR